MASHVLVPKHSKLNREKKKKLLKEYGISLVDLPRILKSDSSIEDLNPEIGDVIEITRPSRTAKNSKYYRVVVSG